MLPGTSAQEAALLGERIKSSWEATATAEFKVKLTSSFGISGYQRGDSVSTLIDRADQALYEAKRLGKNQVVLVEEDKAEDLEAQTQKVEHFLKVLAR
jgi:diguanylate cyclase (GGDEF)-like protein